LDGVKTQKYLQRDQRTILERAVLPLSRFTLDLEELLPLISSGDMEKIRKRRLRRLWLPQSPLRNQKKQKHQQEEKFLKLPLQLKSNSLQVEQAQLVLGNSLRS
jgi:hypothetical protein